MLTKVIVKCVRRFMFRYISSFSRTSVSVNFLQWIIVRVLFL